MKTTLFLLLTTLALHASAQKFTPKSTAKITKEPQERVILVNGQNYVLHMSTSGAYYELRKSKSGNEYKNYLGYLTTYFYESSSVFSNKAETEYWVLGVAESGYLKKIPLFMIKE